MVTALFDFRDLVYPGIDGEPSAETEHNVHIVDQAMNDTFQRLAASGKKIVVFFTTPFLDFDPIQCQQRPFRLRSQARAERFLDEMCVQGSAAMVPRKTERPGQPLPDDYAVRSVKCPLPGGAMRSTSAKRQIDLFRLFPFESARGRNGGGAIRFLASTRSAGLAIGVSLGNPLAGEGA